MMELIEQRFVKINIILLMLVFFISSCKETVNEGSLECILDAFEVDINGMDILVGQVDGWSDTTSLISVVYHKKSIEIPIASNLKGIYKGKDIFFYQSTIDSLDKREYNRIPNAIKWKKITPKKIGEDYISPPYDPINIQVEYNFESNCIGEVIRGKGYIDAGVISKCSCE